MINHLRMLGDIGVTARDDRQLEPGEDWKRRIEDAFAVADTAIVLVSAGLLNSDYAVELPMLQHAREHRGLRLVPVHVRSVSEDVLAAAGLLELQWLSSPDDPLVRWTRPRREQEAWKPLCERLPGKPARRHA
jgi:hypothetical protein